MILDWHLRDALEAFYDIAFERARDDYRHDCLVYAIQAPWAGKDAKLAPPALPEILRE